MIFWTINYLACLSISILFTELLIQKILVIAFKRKLFDMPDDRKIHNGVVPRLGGISFLPALLFAFCLMVGMDIMFFPDMIIPGLKQVVLPVIFSACALILIYLVGLADDLVGVNYRAKFVVQIIAGILIIFAGLYIGKLHGFLWIYDLPVWVGCFFTVFGIIYVVNSVNLIDGIDGLASALSAVALIWYSYILWVSGNYAYMMLAGATLGTLIPFFYYNVYGDASRRKKIFMGDTGSLTVGLILSILAIKVFDLPDNNALPQFNVFVMAISPLMLPCFDVVRVFFHRVKRGRNPFCPDKSHIHHKLLALGFRQRYALIMIVCTDILLVIGNVLLSRFLQPTIVILLDVALLVVGNMILTRFIRKREVRTGSNLYE